jgi:hypothetical protein
MYKRSLSLLAGLGAIVAQSQANVIPITSPAALPTTDTIGWGQLGNPFTSVASPSTVTSAGGISASISDAGGAFERRDEGDGWGGNFASGSKLLWNLGNGPDTITFGTPVYGAGAQIQADFFGAFTAVISAYGAGNVLLGSESFNGVSGNTGSAIFAGLDSTTPIYSIVFSLSSASYLPTDFAINTLDLNTTSVPDAGMSSWLLGISTLALGLYRRKIAKS